MGAGFKEGGTEVAQAYFTKVWDGYTLSDTAGFQDGKFSSKWRPEGKEWYEMLDEGIIGAFMGGNVNVATQGINGITGNNRQKRAEILLRPKADNDYINEKSKEIKSLFDERQNTEDVGLQDRIDAQIKTLSNEIIVKQTQSQKIVRSLRGDALVEYAKNVDLINKRNKALAGDGLESTLLKGFSTKRMMVRDRDLARKRNGEIWKDHIHKSLNNNLDISEAYAKEAGLEQVVIENPDEFQKVYENTKAGKEQAKSNNGIYEDLSMADGFFDGSGRWYINKARALETEAISVGSHELLHGVMKSTLRDGEGNMTKEGMGIIKSFIGSLSRNEYRVVQRRIDSSYRYKRDNKSEK